MIYIILTLFCFAIIQYSLTSSLVGEDDEQYFF